MSSQLSVSPRRSRNDRQVETAERLMAAGLAELREAGHEAVTVRGVAQRAGVSPATAYTYIASRNHLFAELFWRFLIEDDHEPAGTDPAARVRSVTSHLAARLAAEPELALAVTPALLGSDPDVARLRLRIGSSLVERFRTALGSDADPAVLEAVVLAFSGALLQAGMGMLTYPGMGERLDSVITAILKGHAA